MDASTYQIGVMPVNSTALTGRYLRLRVRGKAARAFIAADLYSGSKRLVEPTLEQAAFIAGSDVGAVKWALRRQQFREAVIAGVMPLVPPRERAPVNVPVPQVDDAHIIDLVRRIGTQRVLEAACAVEAAQ